MAESKMVTISTYPIYSDTVPILPSGFPITSHTRTVLV